MKLTIPLIAIGIIVVSCKKEDPPQEDCEPLVVQNHNNDTIFPSDYIMAYPGSWWEYDSGYIDSCTSWKTAPYRTVTSVGNCDIVNEEQCIIPEGLVYASNIAFNKKLYTVGNYNPTLVTTIYDTLIGTFQNDVIHGGSGTGAYTKYLIGETLDRLSSMTIGTTTYYDVLHVRLEEETQFGHWGGIGPVYVKELWLAKDVGLIKYIDSENYFDMELVDHYIAPY